MQAPDVIYRAGSLLAEIEPFLQSKKKMAEKWKRPRKGWVKLNVDAAFFSDGQWGSAAMIIRDELGLECLVVAAKMIRLDNVLDAENAEATAALRGVEFAIELGFSRVILEADAKSVIDALRFGLGPINHVGTLIDDIALASKQFDFFVAVHVPREANTVAHSLTRVALIKGDGIWVDSVPFAISSCIRDDYLE